jgi:wyosine [tRNA(Phe)-imidazoG37] synthetase (radical SAM superfamily)
MSENPQDSESLADAFHKLGVNLVETLRSAWDTPERKKLQQEVEESLVSLSASVKNEFDTFNESPTGQRLKADVEDLRERVRSGEAETQVRLELIKALQLVNTELEKAASRLKRSEEQGSTPEPPRTPES